MLEQMRRSGRKLLVNCDEHGYHIRDVLQVTHDGDVGTVRYLAKIIATAQTFHEAVFAAVIELHHREKDYEDKSIRRHFQHGSES